MLPAVTRAWSFRAVIATALGQQITGESLSPHRLEGGRLATDELHNGNGAIKGAPSPILSRRTCSVAEP